MARFANGHRWELAMGLVSGIHGCGIPYFWQSHDFFCLTC